MLRLRGYIKEKTFFWIRRKNIEMGGSAMMAVRVVPVREDEEEEEEEEEG